MRLFTAINIIPGEKLLNTVNLLASNLHHEKILWVNSNKLHITLKFLGEIDSRKLPEIIDLHNKVIEKYSTFNLNIEKTGVFGSSYNPKVIWFGVNPSESVALLANELESSLDLLGFKSDGQNFVPHLTIGRIKSIQNKVLFHKIISNFKNEFFQEINVKKIILYESILKTKGAIHNVIKEFKLK